MAFKHIRENITNTNTDQTIYTVPAGKEFVLTRKRARDASADHVGTVTFKLGTSTIEELSFSSSIAEIGEGTKLLCSAGAVIKARSTFAGAMAEAMGVEFKAGTWATVNESNPDSPVIPDTPESSSSSSIEPEPSSSSSSQGGGDSFSWGTTPSLIIASTSYPSFDGTYNWNGTSYGNSSDSDAVLWSHNDTLYGIDVYYKLEYDGGMQQYFCTDSDLLTGSWINSGGSSVDVTVSVAGNGGGSQQMSDGYVGNLSVNYTPYGLSNDVYTFNILDNNATGTNRVWKCMTTEGGDWIIYYHDRWEMYHNADFAPDSREGVISFIGGPMSIVGYNSTIEGTWTDGNISISLP